MEQNSSTRRRAGESGARVYGRERIAGITSGSARGRHLVHEEEDWTRGPAGRVHSLGPDRKFPAVRARKVDTLRCNTTGATRLSGFGRSASVPSPSCTWEDEESARLGNRRVVAQALSGGKSGLHRAACRLTAGDVRSKFTLRIV